LRRAVTALLGGHGLQIINVIADSELSELDAMMAMTDTADALATGARKDAYAG
jgi:hypothetical protein